MSNEAILQCDTFLAAADLSAHQWKVMKITADRTCNITTAAGEKCIGILQNDPFEAGETANVAVYGRTKALYGATITAGQSLSTNASGTMKVAVAGEYVIAQARIGGVSGDVGEVYLIHSGADDGPY